MKRFKWLIGGLILALIAFAVIYLLPFTSKAALLDMGAIVNTPQPNLVAVNARGRGLCDLAKDNTDLQRATQLFLSHLSPSATSEVKELRKSCENLKNLEDWTVRVCVNSEQNQGQTMVLRGLAFFNSPLEETLTSLKADLDKPTQDYELPADVEAKPAFKISSDGNDLYVATMARSGKTLVLVGTSVEQIVDLNNRVIKLPADEHLPKFPEKGKGLRFNVFCEPKNMEDILSVNTMTPSMSLAEKINLEGAVTTDDQSVKVDLSTDQDSVHFPFKVDLNAKLASNGSYGIGVPLVTIQSQSPYIPEDADLISLFTDALKADPALQSNVSNIFNSLHITNEDLVRIFRNPSSATLSYDPADNNVALVIRMAKLPQSLLQRATMLLTLVGAYPQDDSLFFSLPTMDLISPKIGTVHGMFKSTDLETLLMISTKPLTLDILKTPLELKKTKDFSNSASVIYVDMENLNKALAYYQLDHELSPKDKELLSLFDTFSIDSLPLESHVILKVLPVTKPEQPTLPAENQPEKPKK